MRGLFVALAAACAAAAAHIIAIPADADAIVTLAGKEARRLVMQVSASRTLPELVQGVPAAGSHVNISVNAQLADGATEERYRIVQRGEGVLVEGASPVAALYGVYRFAELLGVRFSLAGDVIPAPGAALLDVDSHPLGQTPGLPVDDTPIFKTRGLHPFHDFAAGPDAWDVDEYGRIAEAVAKARGGFLGFHTYPLREPLVWVGLEDQFDPSTGEVAWSYNTSWATTEETFWGYTPVPTSDYGFGAPGAFPADCSGGPVTLGPPAICPFPTTASQNNEVFNRAGAVIASAIGFARSLGIETTVGTEAPLAAPPQPAPEPGTLTPLWLYVSSSRGDSFATTTLCSECEGLYRFAGAVALVHTTAPSPDAVPLVSWYNGALEDNWLTTSADAPPAPGYGKVRVEGWALPAAAAGANASLVQLSQYARPGDHRVACPGAGAANATRDGFHSLGPIASVDPAPDGLVPGIPSTEALYRGIFARLKALGAAPDQYWIGTPESWEWTHVNMSNPIVTETVADMMAADRARKAVAPEMKLATYGWVLGPLGNRSFLDGVLPSDWTLSSLDQLVGWAPVDPAYGQLRHHDAIVIPWAEDDPRLTAPQLWVTRSIQHGSEAQAYNATGLVNIHWRTRAVAPQVAATARRAWNATLTPGAFWRDWARAEFGPSAGAAAVPLFESVDSFSAPMPVSWIAGPGGLKPDASQCALAATNYSFVDPFCALRPTLLADAAASPPLADAASLERFDYWCSAFRYWRLLATTQCAWAGYASAVAAVEKIADPAQRAAAARAQAFPARAALVANATAMMARQLESASTLGERGITTNLRSRSLNKALFDQTEPLKALANVTALPADCMPPTAYSGAPRLRVPSPRGVLPAGDDLRVTAWAFLPPGADPGPPTLRWRAMGSGKQWNAVKLAPWGQGRSLWRGVVSAPADDTEWFVSLGDSLTFPPGGEAAPFVTVVHGSA